MSNKLIRDIDNELWREVKAQARLEAIPITAWVEEALRTMLGSEQRRRKRLPLQAICHFCRQPIYKRPKEGQKKMIVHHDQQNNRNASVAMLVCWQCHKERHRRLGWGMGSANFFTCVICKRRLPKKQLGYELPKTSDTWLTTKVKYRSPDGEIKYRERKGRLPVSRVCIYCWQKGIAFNDNGIPIAKPALQEAPGSGGTAL